MNLPSRMRDLKSAKIIAGEPFKDEDDFFTTIWITGFYFRYGDCYYLVIEELRVTDDDDGLSKTSEYTMYSRFSPIRKLTRNVISEPLKFRFKQMRGFDIPEKIKKYVGSKSGAVNS